MFVSSSAATICNSKIERKKLFSSFRQKKVCPEKKILAPSPEIQICLRAIYRNFDYFFLSKFLNRYRINECNLEKRKIHLHSSKMNKKKISNKGYFPIFPLFVHDSSITKKKNQTFIKKLRRCSMIANDSTPK